MPVFKIHSVEVNEPLNKSNVIQLINDIGIDKAQVYMQALEDFTSQIEFIAYKHRYEEGHHQINSPHMARKLVTKLYEHNVEVLDFYKTIVSNLPDNEPKP